MSSRWSVPIGLASLALVGACALLFIYSAGEDSIRGLYFFVPSNSAPVSSNPSNNTSLPDYELHQTSTERETNDDDANIVPPTWPPMAEGAMKHLNELHHGIPRIVHMVWLANPLKPFIIASLDSVLRFMPYVTFKLHILTPEGANSTVLEAIRARFEDQLEPFLKVPNFDLQIVLHDDVPSELIGTPVEGKGITQAHMGGRVQNLLNAKGGGDRGGSPHGGNRNAIVHASDFYRMLCVYREGGLYMDTDQIMLEDIWPLLDNMGSFVLCENRLHGKEDGSCKLVNSLFAFPPGHQFLADGLERVATLIDRHLVNGLFPIRGKAKGEPNHVWFTAIGPNLFTRIKGKWMGEKKDVWTVRGAFPSSLTIKKVRKRPSRGAQLYANITSVETSVTILGRRYFIPTFWSELTLNKPITPKYAEMYTRAYSFHLWEMGKSSQNQIRPYFVNIIRDKPDSVLAYLHRKFCLILCDASKLDRPTKPFADYLAPNATDLASRQILPSLPDSSSVVADKASTVSLL